MQVSLKDNPSLRFKLWEAALICEVQPIKLYGWIRKGWLKPAEKGTTAAHNGHKFHPGQLYGIAAVESLMVSTRGCRPEAIKTVLDTFTNAPDSFLRGLMEEQLTPHREEEVASYAAQCPILCDQGKPHVKRQLHHPLGDNYNS